MGLNLRENQNLQKHNQTLTRVTVQQRYQIKQKERSDR